MSTSGIHDTIKEVTVSLNASGENHLQYNLRYIYIKRIYRRNQDKSKKRFQPQLATWAVLTKAKNILIWMALLRFYKLDTSYHFTVTDTMLRCPYSRKKPCYVCYIYEVITISLIGLIWLVPLRLLFGIFLFWRWNFLPWWGSGVAFGASNRWQPPTNTTGLTANDSTIAWTWATNAEATMSQSMFCFFDYNMHYTEPQLNVLIWSLQNSSTLDREQFFMSTIVARQRIDCKWQDTPLTKVFLVGDEYAALKRRAQACFVWNKLNEIGLKNRRLLYHLILTIMDIFLQMRSLAQFATLPCLT